MRHKLPKGPEWWRPKSPQLTVYRVHCFTFARFRELTNTGFVTRIDMSQPPPEIMYFRAKPQFRPDSIKAIRKQIADQIRLERRAIP